MPIRSIVVPYMVYKIPMNLYHLISMYVRYFIGIEICTPYMIFILPRLIMCAISFVNDWSLYRTCKLYGLRHDIRLLALASSFVMIVFATHTFSNSIEMALCSLLLYVVADCMQHTNSVIFQREILDEKYQAAKTTHEKVKIYKMRAILPAHNTYRGAIVAAIFVFGLFNRPTFLFFGAPIIFFWMLRGMGTKTVTRFDFDVRFLCLLGYCAPIILLFIVVDSMYYGFLTLPDIDYMDISMESFVVTPLNFFIYNAKSSNTATHGVHPQYLHLLVNIPLLYNIIGIIGVCSFLNMIYRYAHFIIMIMIIWCCCCWWCFK